MKAALLLAVFLTLNLRAEESLIRPRIIDDWSGYALEHFLTEEAGVFTTRRQSLAIDSKTFLAVEPGRSYVLSGSFRKTPGAKNANFHLSFGVLPCDAEGKRIFNSHINPFPDSETILSRKAEKDDRQIFVKDASRWRKRRWTVAAFNIEEQYKDLPNAEISPTVLSINEAGEDEWSVTFRTGLPKAYQAGTAVRQHFANNRHFICAGAAQIRQLPEQWSEFSGKISGMLPLGQQSNNEFWHGSKTARIRIEGKGDLQFKDIQLKKED